MIGRWEWIILLLGFLGLLLWERRSIGRAIRQAKERDRDNRP